MLKDFSNLSLKISYDSGKDNILRDFYIPVLSTANRYETVLPDSFRQVLWL